MIARTSSILVSVAALKAFPNLIIATESAWPSIGLFGSLGEANRKRGGTFFVQSSRPLHEIGDDRLRQSTQRNDMSVSIFRPRRRNCPGRVLGVVEPLEFFQFCPSQLGDTHASQDYKPKSLANALRVRRISDSAPKKPNLVIGQHPSGRRFLRSLLEPRARISGHKLRVERETEDFREQGLHPIGLDRRSLRDDAFAKGDDVAASDPVERALTPKREDVQVQVPLVCLCGPLVPARVLVHVAIRKRFEGSSWRFASLFALLLDGVDATRDLSAKLQRAFAGHLQSDSRIRAYRRSRQPA